MRLRFEAHALLLEVQDEGVGLRGVQPGRGLGMTSMRERAELLNGRVEFLEQSGGGTLVRATVPLEPNPIRPTETHVGA